MSYLTRCNFCTLARIRRRAEANGNTVWTTPSRFDGWTAVFTSASDRPVAHFAALTDECACTTKAEAPA